MLEVLNGMTVVDLTSNVAGPYATMVLHDLGATVWKIESPEGDVVRRWPPFAADGTSTTFLALNRGKKSIILDLKTEEGRAALRAMLAHADALVSSMRPGAMDRLGLTATKLTTVNPRLVCADISAFGGLGPRGNQPGFDAVIQAYTGIMDLTGYPDQPPARVGTGIVDIGTGMWAALGVVGALLQRERDGVGRAVSATLFGTAVGFLVHHLASVEHARVVPTRIGTAQHNSAPYEAFAAADGMVMVGVTGPILWQRFCSAIGWPKLALHPEYLTNDLRVANRAVLHEVIEERTRQLVVADLVGRLSEHGVPCSPVRTVAELIGDEQLHEAGLWQPTKHGGSAAVTPLRIGGTGSQVGASAAALGADTADVLTAVGLGEGQLRALGRASGARASDSGAATMSEDRA